MTTNAKCILLDIEGTTSSVKFVYDVMFPFARRELEGFIRRHFNEAEHSRTWDLLAQDVGASDVKDLTARRELPADDEGMIRAVCDTATDLMDRDAKATGLKDLQGKIWLAGFESGELKAHVYADVPPALRRWKDAGLDIRIYSSGSIVAQKLFFGHTEAGNLLSMFSGHYDTTTGPKREASSYAKIAADWNTPPGQILFLSDIVEELDAARAAGFQTGLLLRPENAKLSHTNGHQTLENFSQIELA